jgi:hypothetical protein
VGEPATRADAVRMRVGEPLTMPVFDTVRSFVGQRQSSGFAQYLDGTHFVVFEEPEAADLVYTWLKSTADGEPILWDGTGQ